MDGAINFRGFAVGNPYVDPFSNDATMIEAFYAHGLVSRPVYKPWYQNCRDEDNFSEVSLINLFGCNHCSIPTFVFF